MGKEFETVTYVLWTIQALLAVLFLFAGGMKLVMPLEDIAAQSQVALPGIFIRFVGVCEVAGALGLLLPGLLRIRQDLTPLAAKGLVLLMVGAAMFTPPETLEMAAMPIVIGVLAACVAYGRSRASRRGASRRPSLQPAS
jgi:hypothetical protein